LKLLIVIALLALAGAVAFFLLGKRGKPAPAELPPPEDRAAQAQSAPAAADDVSVGIRAFMNGRFEEAFAILEPAARDNHLKAQKLLAKMYFAGNGVPADKGQYLYWLKRAAENGDKAAKAKVKKLEADRA